MTTCDICGSENEPKAYFLDMGPVGSYRGDRNSGFYAEMHFCSRECMDLMSNRLCQVIQDFRLNLKAIKEAEAEAAR